MEEKDFIKDLFQEKLSNFETPVRPEVWSTISSSIGATSAASGLSLITKLIIGTSLTAAVSAVIWFSVSNSEKESTPEKEPAKIENPSVVQTKEDDLNKETTQPKFSVNPIKPIEDNFILLPPEPNFTIESEENLITANPNNSVVEFNSNIFEENNNLGSPIEDKTQPNEQSFVSNNNSNSKNPSNSSDVKISFPNVFTPNGDGNNDLFSIPNMELSDFSLVVLDEKGKTVFTTTELEFNWDGTIMNGEKAPVGDYVYFITAKDAIGKSFTKYSNLSIRY